MTLHIQDTMTGAKRPFEPIEPGKVRLYVCGVTPYARCHLGHARCYMAYDLIYRYLGYLGYEVTYVRNFTDVDDKIINRAAEQGIEPLALAQKNIDAFYEDMDALGIARPQLEPRVSTSIDDIIKLVSTLIERGLAYESKGDVYYSVESFEGYGKLSKRNLDEMRESAGERIEINPKKRSPMDFALWKGAKPGEIKWDSPWGEGRPGWHIECSAMSLGAFGDRFDIHGGGRDLIFPHHENEIAQSEGAVGHSCVNFWVHNGFINIDNEKMGKSLGNAFNVSDIFGRYEPLVLRYFLLSASHYANPVNFTDGLLDECAARMAYFYETLRKVEVLLSEEGEPFGGPLSHKELLDTFEDRFRAALDDDFNTVRAMDPLSELFKALNELGSVRKMKQKPVAAATARALLGKLRMVDEVLNLFGEAPTVYLARHRQKAALRREIDLDWIAEQIEERLTARKNKDWAAADAVRDRVSARGVVLMDRPDGGTDWSVSDVKPS